MNDHRILTKADILQGTDHVENVYFEDLEGCLPLRPLTSGQWAQVQAEMMAEMSVSGTPGKQRPGGKLGADLISTQMTFDVGKVQRHLEKAYALAVAYSIADGSKWTPEEVEQLRPAEVVEKIATEVFRLSKVEVAASEMQSFRNVGGGSGDSSLVLVGDSAGPDSRSTDGSADAVPASDSATTEPGDSAD